MWSSARGAKCLTISGLSEFFVAQINIGAKRNAKNGAVTGSAAEERFHELMTFVEGRSELGLDLVVAGRSGRRDV
jgi:hypothetical protein